METENMIKFSVLKNVFKNVLTVSDGIMTLTIGLREDNGKRSLKVEEEVFDKELNIWEVRNLVEFLQGCSLGKWAGIDGLY